MSDNHRSRRDFLKSSAVIASFALVGGSLPAFAIEGEAQRKQFQYQEQPKDGKHCALCALYKPAADDKTPGGCQLIPGPISPNGWCVAFAPKPQ